MRHRPYYSPRRLIAGFLGSVLLIATVSAGRTENPVAAPKKKPPAIFPEKATWQPSSIFERDEKKKDGTTPKDLDDQPRMNLSGAACVPTTPKFTSCLIANDEFGYAQFFTIEGTTLHPRQLILLSDAKKDPDAEGVAYGGGHFYITGSHGRSRNKDNEGESSYAVFRFPVDPVTGATPFKVSAEKVVGVESSGRLHHAIHDACVKAAPLADDCSVRNAHNKKLAEGGVNIEGIAFKDGRLHFGLRGPSSKDGKAYVLSVDAEALFSKDKDLDSKTISLPLGKNVGIRDLATVSDGILVLAGPTREEDVPYAIWLWDGVGNNARKLAPLNLDAIGKGAKAEILLPLEETASGFRVLVMFDGIANGGAVSFSVDR